MSGQMEFSFDDNEKTRQAGKAMKMLEILRRGPMTNLELSRLGFLRYGAYVGDLKGRGYDIRVRKGKARGEWIYQFVGYKKRVKCSQTMQDRYYASAHWRAKRLERLAFDGNRCCHCRSTEDLQVHHWTYDLFREDIEDLSTLCANCHERVHSYAQVRISFPTSISAEDAERLRGSK